jgi:CheY-like chemotaxis protein
MVSGSEVMETADLDSALALTQEHDDLDLILLDLNMPGMHGLNGLINLRNEAPTIPVVIVRPSRTSRSCCKPSPTAPWASSPSPRRAAR